MDSRRNGSLGRTGLPAFALLLSGCLSPRAQVEQAMLAHQPPPTHFLQTASVYQVRCPDVLQVDIAGLPQCSGRKRLGADGRLDLGTAGRPNVDGATTPEIVRIIAQTVGVAPQQVHVEVVEYNSQYVYVFGRAAGLQRAVPYQGPETVLDLLRRAGDLPAGAAIGDIKVIRPHIAEGKTPEIFHVDLNAIVAGNDPETNVLLQPYDQIHVGQSRRSCFRDCLPPWLRPLYECLCGMKCPAAPRP
jgi:protein involved in polysaccharide export with SLBB domain